jgi:NAD-dependent deacetylase
VVGARTNATPEPRNAGGAAARVRAARRLAILTGAGMSAEAGVPTFREAQTGLWAQFRPEDLATPAAFDAHPERVLDWYRWRLSTAASVHPHAGHRAIARRQRRDPATLVLTQNVDGLHQCAWRDAGDGDAPDADAPVVELHGSVRRLRCERCGARQPWPTPDPGGVLVHGCGARLRPDVVWFGEALPAAAWARAERAASSCDVMLVVGTSALVMPVATLPHVARAHGAYVVEVNPERTPLTAHCDAHVARTAAVALPELLG